MPECWLEGARHVKVEPLKLMGGVIGPYHCSVEKREADAEQVEQLVREALSRRGWTEAKTGKRRKTDAL